nr:SHOCT domain-containing protein [Butyricicoccus pullicaecorum]
MPATSSIGSEVARMSKEQLTNEKLYQATMSMVRKMLAEGLISEEEYRQIDTMFLEKYRPVFGTLFSEIR